MTKLNELLLTNKTVFTLDDLSVIWGQSKRSNTSQSAKEYARAGELIRLRRGLYALPKTAPAPTVVAGKLVTPSYMTGEIVLKKYGLTYQIDNRVTSAALVSRKIELDGTVYVYYKFHENIFFNPRGVGDEGGVTMATRERAIADLVYLHGDHYPFEDLSGVDWPELMEIGKIYEKKSVVENIIKMEKRYAER